MKLFICLSLTMIYYLNVFAQFNDTTNYHIALLSSGSVNLTNNERAYLLNNSLNFGVKKKSMVFNSNTSWLYGKQNNSLSNNDFSTTMNFNLYKTFPHFYYWGLVNYNTSYSLQIRNQLLAGGGIAYNFIDKPDAYVNVSNGVLFDNSSLVELNNYNTLRNSLRLQYHVLIKDIITIDGTHFLQNSYSRKGDYIIRSATTVGLKIRKWISLTTALNYNKLNITQRENLNLTYGLSIDKYF
ncbi:DUF481 domain-containing protein [Pedobacter rhodius]|uniref:DUF481 domain-containing protein n=1 Tax=Pedobacter rhodius TaxID=3004098 RepID=A0ABT4KUK6_9SPHI|nr:DUF481 domain-containing protein [Pedobacter sp. SJ11]MCZ4222623.1 DUF481 domain-containing protein [Pedobacter sp. SJ11]